MRFPNRNVLWATCLVDELFRSGLRFACVSPGSRSTPLTLALLRHGSIRVLVNPDERVSAFVALGIGKATGVPAAVVCTSGTAAAHLLPAVIEASHAQVPMLVLTANRPPELQGWGAAQTIDQQGLYGRFVRSAVALPPPEPTTALLRALRQTVCRSWADAVRTPAGPVHLDVPFREPVAPLEVAGDVPEGLDLAARDGGAPSAHFESPVALPSRVALESAALRLAHAERPLLAIGPLDAKRDLAEAISSLATRLDLPVLAEATSAAGLVGSIPQRIGHGDLLLRHAPTAATLAPDLVLRLGAAPISRHVARFLDGAPHTLRLDAPGYPVDPSHRADTFLQGDLTATLTALAALLPAAPSHASWRERWREPERRAARALSSHFESHEFDELHVADRLLAAVPHDWPLFVASSMPIRDLETVRGNRVRTAPTLASRGVNGIDGTLSTATGVALASGGRAAVLLGDLATLHDLNGLLAARQSGASLVALLVNNDGGGIFEFLEVAERVERQEFEAAWGTPHGLDFAAAARAFGVTHRAATTPAELEQALAQAFTAGGVQLVEARIDRPTNVRRHRDLWKRLARELEAAP